MKLTILDYTYVQSQAFLCQGRKPRGKKKPGRYIAGGNGSEIRAENVRVLVDLHDEETGETAYGVDLYHCLKDLTGDYGKLTERRVGKILALYEKHQPFAADDWDMWDRLPGIEKAFQSH